MPTLTPAAASILSCAAALVLTPLSIRLSRAAGWLDHPDGSRKQHRTPVPPSGGVAVFAALLLAGAFVPGASALLPGAAVVFGAGLVDDLMGLHPWSKLALQSVAAVLAVWLAGLTLHFPGGGVVAVFWLLLCANSFNLLDGLDGLAATAGAIGAIALLFLRGAPVGLLAIVAGALLGFLVYNRPSARVFLGDSGSLTAGFLLGAAALWTANGDPSRLLRPAIALALPIGDTLWTAARRAFAGHSLFEGDRGHIHHRVLEFAASPARALVLLAVVSVLAGLAAVLLP